MNDQNLVPPLHNLTISDASRWTVLIVDDEPDNREIAKMVLSFSGAKVHTAVHGDEGLKLLDGISPTFVLLDLSMPIVDGWEMLKHMKENSKTQNIPVIALTAHAMAGDRERVIEAGFDGYIAKPFRVSTFMPELIRCLQGAVEPTRAQTT